MKNLIIGILLMFAVGCAHQPCKTADQVMADKGVVLECKRVTMYEGERVTRCLILKDGKAKWKTVFKSHCGQYDRSW